MESDSSPHVLVGTSRIAGRYEPVSILGVGATSIVYLARDTMLGGEPVALKLFHASCPEDSPALRRFLREAKALMELDDPHIVRSYGCGFHEDEDSGDPRPFIVLEHLDAVPLVDFVRRPSTDFTAILLLLQKLARALRTLHAHGLLHRDIKPSNVLVTDTGNPVLLDLGLAMDLRADAPPSRLSCGTFDWMAPEQRSSNDLDERSDLYSFGLLALGCILRFPEGFPARSAASGTRAESLARSVPRTAAPPALIRLIERLISEHPDDRPASATVVAEALQRIPFTTGTNRRPILFRAAVGVPAALLTLALLVIGGLQALAALAPRAHYRLERAIGLSLLPEQTMLSRRSWRILGASVDEMLIASIYLRDHELTDALLAQTGIEESFYSPHLDRPIVAALIAGNRPLFQRLVDEFLLPRGGYEGRSTAWYAVANGRPEFLDLILSSGELPAPMDADSQCAMLLHLDLVTLERLIRAGFFSISGELQMSPFLRQLAASADALDRMELLVRTRILKITRDVHGKSLLHRVAAVGWTAGLLRLYRMHPDRMEPADSGRGPISFALMRASLGEISLLAAEVLASDDLLRRTPDVELVLLLTKRGVLERTLGVPSREDETRVTG